jgi:Ca2+-binding RTX toxin-like protein
MSGDELTSIEKNGNYWLSKSNTAYHIVNPNATSLDIIEANGYYSLAKGGDTYYVLDGNGNSTRLDDWDITNRFDSENQFKWSLIQVEATGPGMLGGGAYALLWYTPSFFYQIAQGYSQNITDFSGHQINLYNTSVANLESHFQVDLDGNGSTSIKSNQTYHSIDITSHQHHLDDGHGGESIILKRDNVIIDPNSNGGLNATQVQKNGSNYEVLLEHANVKYDVWKVDEFGNFVSSIKAKLWEDEEKFSDALDEHGDKIKVDLNGDGDTGLVSVEAIGNAYLKHGDNTYNSAPQYYIVDDTNTNIVSSHIGLTRGEEKGPTSYTGWSATQVEKNGSHYEVLWTNPTGNNYDVWQVDTSGNFVSSIKAKLWEDEFKFNVDLNGDGSGAGRNNIYGVGNDNIFGSIGHDTFDGGDGNDHINGWKGHDTLIGGNGDDKISGDGGSHYAGNDILFGNAGNDWLRGRDGDDQIDGGTGSDTIITDSGSDQIILRAGDGGNTLSDADIITDFTDGNDNFGLTTSLSFGDLTRTQGSGDYANDTIIKYGSEYLAILQNIDVSLLTEADFEDLDIA